MNTKYLVFSSVTYALRSMSVLQKHGISSRLEKVKNISAIGGCGYVLAISNAIFDTAYSIISREGIRIIDVLDGQ